ncbi:MAG: DUF6073 family protein, partial [bacterium]
PKHVTSRISHKPPARGEFYMHPGCTPLFDPNEQPVPILVCVIYHTPDPEPPEIDKFPNSKADVEFQTPFGTETMVLRGPTTVRVDIGPQGEAHDLDLDGNDEVLTEMVQLELSGTSPTLGPVNIHIRPPAMDPFRQTMGLIREQTNTMPGTLEVPPFGPGLADSFFDVFFEVEIPAAGLILHNHDPKHMTAILSHKPPAQGEYYEHPGCTDLFDENENLSGRICNTRHTPDPFPELCDPGPVCLVDADCNDGNTCTTDACASGCCAHDNVFGPPLCYPPGGQYCYLTGLNIAMGIGAASTSCNLSGSTVVQRSNPPPNRGLGGMIETEILQMDLRGSCPGLGQVRVTQSPTGTSPGMDHAMGADSDFAVDSFFDITYRIDFTGQGFALHNDAPDRKTASIPFWPVSNVSFIGPQGGPVPLKDDSGNVVGQIVFNSMQFLEEVPCEP